MNAAGGVVQANNYYPSGVTMAELPRRSDQGVQPYKFGGKELDRSYGLDFYDFEARAYNPVLMRFTGFDPLASKYPGISPYAYCANNPVRYIDLDGRDIVDAHGRVMYKNGQWLSNATTGAKLIASSMQLTPSGKEAFYNLVKANYGVQLVYDQTSDIGKIGQSERSFDGAGNTTKATITIFEKNLTAELNFLTDFQEKGLKLSEGQEFSPSQKAMLKEGIPTQSERIGQVGVHESEHVLNPNAWGSARDPEGFAVKAEIKAIKETNMNKLLPIKIEIPQIKLDYKLNLP
jgi:RHS repeat-associated protein